MALEDNNGDAISCIVLMIDSLAKENEAVVQLETLHQDDCNIFKMMKDEAVDNENINEHSPVSEEAREHLYSCTCNVTIETTFKRGDGETLLVTFPLSDAKEKHPWLDDQEQTKEFLESAKKEESNRLLDEMKPAFKQRMGQPSEPWASPKKKSDTLH